MENPQYGNQSFFLVMCVSSWMHWPWLVVHWPSALVLVFLQLVLCVLWVFKFLVGMCGVSCGWQSTLSFVRNCFIARSNESNEINLHC